MYLYESAAIYVFSLPSHRGMRYNSLAFSRKPDRKCFLKRPITETSINKEQMAWIETQTGSNDDDDDDDDNDDDG